MLVPTTCFNCESACGLLAYVDRETLAGPEVRGQPGAPGIRGRNCAKGPATVNQITDPDRILYPLKRAGARGEGKWERVSWDEALDDIAGRIRAALQEGRHERDHVPRGPAGRGRLHRARARGLGGRRPQLPHEHLLERRARRLPLLDGDRPAQPDHANAKVMLLSARTSRRATTSTRTPSGSSRREGTARSSSCSTRGCPTRRRTPTTGCRPTRARRPRSSWRSPPGPDPRAAATTASSSAAGGTGGSTWTPCSRTPARPSRSSRPRSTRCTASTRSSSPPPSPGSTSTQLREVARDRGGRGHAPRDAQLALAPRPGTSAAGRCPARSSCSTRCSARWPRRAGPTPTPGTSSFPRPIRLPPRHPAHWNELTWPREYPLALIEMSFLLPHFLTKERGAGSTSTSRASTTRCGRTPTASRGSRCSRTPSASACTWR